MEWKVKVTRLSAINNFEDGGIKIIDVKFSQSSKASLA